MKKAFLPLILGLLFSSCRDNGTDPVTETKTPILPAKMVNAYGREFNIGYDGDKISKITFLENGVSVGYATFTYTGDLITSMLEETAEETIKTSYTYSDGKLIKSDMDFKESNSTEIEKRTINYTYNADGTVLSRTIQGGYTVTELYTLKNDEVIKKVLNSSYNQQSYTYNYDTKNAPFANVRGMKAFAVESFSHLRDYCLHA